ncbi:MAG: glycosyltransferase [Prevotella sp.]|nr:glycosyltransferase [Prevotella sp.]
MMNKRKIYYTLHSGKNSKLAYYVGAYLRDLTPRWMLRPRLAAKLAAAEQRPDRDYIMDRVAYYNRLTPQTPFSREEWMEQSVRLDQQRKMGQKVYYFDTMEYGRWFPGHLRWRIEPGDPRQLMTLPSLIKCRNLANDNGLSVLLNLNKVRHFLFVDDPKPWAQKRNEALFRGDLGARKEGRTVFMRRWYGHPAVDAGMTNHEGDEAWFREKLTIGEQLQHKFIMSLEGNDVASNLKWIMSSNSIAVTPRPTCETWFMEGRLKPDYHYIEVKPDFSDLEEKLHYYLEHQQEAEAIIAHAHEWVAQFQDKQREDLISLLVLQRYFELTNT